MYANVIYVKKNKYICVQSIINEKTKIKNKILIMKEILRNKFCKEIL